jgi:hypothetical protein
MRGFCVAIRLVRDAYACVRERPTGHQHGDLWDELIASDSCFRTSPFAGFILANGIRDGNRQFGSHACGVRRRVSLGHQRDNGRCSLAT